MFKKLVAWLTRHSRREEQVTHLEQLIRDDNQWIAHDPIARALTNRYLEALSDNWRSKSFESSDRLRSRLDRDPNHPKLTCKDLINEQINTLNRELEEFCLKYENRDIESRVFDVLKNDWESRLVELQALKQKADGI